MKLQKLRYIDLRVNECINHIFWSMAIEAGVPILTENCGFDSSTEPVYEIEQVIPENQTDASLISQMQVQLNITLETVSNQIALNQKEITELRYEVGNKTNELTQNLIVLEKVKGELALAKAEIAFKQSEIDSLKAQNQTCHKIKEEISDE